jgi:uncharacterized FAD-dependent dehydrogenase
MKLFKTQQTKFGQKLKNFDRRDAILTGVETRISSPIKVFRDGDFYSGADYRN